MPKNKKKKNETKIPDVKFINVKDAHPGMYGKHGDNCFFNLDENTTVIGLDPGHANILAIARTDRDTIIPTTYVLPNKYWRVLNGNQRNMQRIHSRVNYMQRRGGTYDNMINRLQNATSKVTSPTRMKCTLCVRKPRTCTD